MKGNNAVLKILVVAILFLLVVASASHAVNLIQGTNRGSTRSTWEDHFNDASKIDPSPPGSGMSDNYEISGGAAKMINTYSAWTDTDWTKMKVIEVTNNAGQTLTGYVLEIIVNYDSDMQSDYDDLRFKHEDDSDTFLDYWIETYDSTQAEAWINIPSLPIGTSELYMFYGNSGASGVSNFGSVFSDWEEEWSQDEKITNHLDNEGTWDADVCFDGTDEFIVAWEEGQAYYPPYTWGFKQEIRASIYDSSGTKLVNDKLIFKDGTTYYRNEDPSIAYGDGKWFVAWEHFDTVANPDAGTMDIKARTVQRSGSNLNLGSVIDVCDLDKCQADPNVEYDSVNNRFLVVWEDVRNGGGDFNIYGQLYDTSGNPVGSEKTITDESDAQCEPWVAFDPVNEQYMIAWEQGETPANGPFDIWVGIFDKDLNQVGSSKKLADGSSSIDYNFPCVYYNSESTEYLVTWNSGDISDDDWHGDVWGTILDSLGSTVVDNFEISTGEYVRTDIVTYSMSGFDDPYFVSYDNNDRIYGKLVSADGEASSSEVQLCVGSDSDVQADWANMDFGDGKIFIAWEDKRENYPSQYDFYPDIFGNLWEMTTQSGSSVTYSIGSEIDQVLLAHVTSIEIEKGAGDYWEEFNAIYTGSTITFSILDGDTGNVIIADINPGGSLSEITASSIRLMATFSRPDPSDTPELDYWSASWIQNNPPNAPSNPSPADGATGVDLDADLSWTCSDPDGDPLTYDVYFGTSSPPPLVSSGQSATTYDPGTMNPGVTYYWKIVAEDNHGASTSGPIWSFTTWINNPPYTPSNPNPQNGATGVDVDADLSWTGGDPDGDTVTYDLYFGTSSPPPLIASDLTDTTYDPGTLDFGVTYYWKIIAEDSYGATTEGPIWVFTTGTNDPPYTPSDPDPTNGATGVDVDGDLSWTGGDPDGDTVTYDIYFGTSSPPPQVATNYPDTTYDPGTMQLDTKYYWQIIAEDIFGATSEGPIWSFTTGTNDPPYTPSNPDPANGATDVPIDYTLSWDGGDPDGDTVTYDLYFSTTDPPDLYRRDLEQPSYPITGMSHDTRYYWYIVAKDNHGAETEGPVWYFTTEWGDENDPPHTPVIRGPTIVKIHTEYEYTVSTTDPEDEDIFYKIYWGDETTDWLGPYTSGEDVIFTHTWTEPWIPYFLRVSAKDTDNNRCTQDGVLLIFTPRNINPAGNLLLKILGRLQDRPIFSILLKIILSSPIFYRMQRI